MFLTIRDEERTIRKIYISKRINEEGYGNLMNLEIMEDIVKIKSQGIDGIGIYIERK